MLVEVYVNFLLILVDEIWFIFVNLVDVVIDFIVLSFCFGVIGFVCVGKIVFLIVLVYNFVYGGRLLVFSVVVGYWMIGVCLQLQLDDVVLRFDYENYVEVFLSDWVWL